MAAALYSGDQRVWANQSPKQLTKKTYMSPRPDSTSLHPPNSLNTTADPPLKVAALTQVVFLPAMRKTGSEDETQQGLVEEVEEVVAEVWAEGIELGWSDGGARWWIPLVDRSSRRRGKEKKNWIGAGGAVFIDENRPFTLATSYYSHGLGEKHARRHGGTWPEFPPSLRRRFTIFPNWAQNRVLWVIFLPKPHSNLVGSKHQT